MKKSRLNAISLAIMIGSASASAQYYQIANQIPQMLQPALSGSLNYKGFVDASYVKGIGQRNADFLELTTTQGFQYSSWFFMGVGAGVEAIFTNPNTSVDRWDNTPDSFDQSKGHSKTGWIIPLYTDFRFNIGSPANTSFYIDLRLGASFLVSNDYLEIGDGFMTNSECFYFKPSVGLRIPMNDIGSQALNTGISYQLVTSNYWYRYSYNTSLSSLGVSIGFEW